MQVQPYGDASQATRTVRVALTGMLLLASSSTLAQQSPALDRMSLWLGGFDAHTDTTISARVDGAHPGADKFNFENDLGLADHRHVARARLDFLLGDTQGFSLDYYRLDRHSDGRLIRDIHYAGNNYQAQADLHARLNVDFGSVAYRWWFGHDDDVFGLGLGAAYYRVNASLMGDVSVDGTSIDRATASNSEGAWAPILQLGWRHALNDQWRIYADSAGVLKNGGRLRGHVVNAALGVEWFPWRNAGLGAEYGYSRIVLHQHKRLYDANLDLTLRGPSLFVRWRL